MMELRSIAPFILTILFFISLAFSDPAPPYNFDCLKSIDQWNQVQGEWLIEKGELKCKPAAFNKIAVFSEHALKVPDWYNISLSAKGLHSAQEKYIGILVGYRDKANYWLCSFRQRERDRATVGLSRIINNKKKCTISIPLKRKPTDTVRFSVENHHSPMFGIKIMVDGHVIVSLSQTGTISKRFGVCLKSSSIIVTNCGVSGIAPR